MSKSAVHFYEFGAFRLDVEQRLLLREGEMVSLRLKDFDLLLALLGRHGRVLGKEELMQRVWPETVVEEANLSHHIFTLRRALGEGNGDGVQYIETLPRRGYRFVAPVLELTGEPEEGAASNGKAEAIQPDSSHSTIRLDSSRPARRAILWRWLAVALVALSGAGGIIYAWRAERQPEIKSLAVLPFKSLDARQDDETLGLRLADALILRLGGSLQQVIVRPVGTVSKYDGKTTDPIAAGREQKVEAVLDASYQRAGERIRVTARLLRVGDGRQLWADTFDARLADPFAPSFALQDALAEQTAQALVRRLTGEERRRLDDRGTENAEAYSLYLKGRATWNRRVSASLRKGIEYFEQAVRLDPNYAAAWSGLADSWTILGQINAVPMSESAANATRTAEKAVALDDRLAEAHASLALVKTYHEWNWAGAEKEFRQAVALNARYSTAWHWYAMFLSTMARHDEAIDAIRRAEELDPASAIINTNHGWILWCARQYEPAAAQLLKTIEMDPQFANAHFKLSLVYETVGKHAQAVAEMARYEEMTGDAAAGDAMREAFARAGWRGYAEWDLKRQEENARQMYIQPAYFALAHARLGDKERAFDWLRRAHAERSEPMLYLKVDPRVDSLRQDARFTDLLRQMNLSP